jgi:hypothetical protein
MLKCDARVTRAALDRTHLSAGLRRPDWALGCFCGTVSQLGFFCSFRTDSDDNFAVSSRPRPCSSMFRTLPEVFHKRSVMLFNGVNRISQHLGDVIRRSSADEHIDRQRISEPMGMGIGHSGALSKGQHPLIEPRSRHYGRGTWIHQNPVC